MLHIRWRVRNDPSWKRLQGKTFFQTYGLWITLKDLFWKLDVIGFIFMGASLGCILVPSILAGGVKSSWNDSKIIGLGWVLISVFSYWKWKYAKFPLIPYRLVKDCGVWTAMAISILIDFIYYMMADYLYIVLVVVVEESAASAARISSLLFFVSTVGSPIIAFIMSSHLDSNLV